MGQEKEEKKADGRVTETDPEKKEQMKRHRERLRAGNLTGLICVVLRLLVWRLRRLCLRIGSLRERGHGKRKNQNNSSRGCA